MAHGFSVSPTQLRRLGDQLTEVSEDLLRADEDGSADAYSDDFGHAGLAGTVLSSHADRALRRRVLAADVDTLGELARQAADSYQETDDGVGAGFASGATPPPGGPAVPV